MKDINITEPFNTKEVENNLKSLSVQGGLVTMTAQVMRFLLQFFSVAILARILLPKDFGLIAMSAGVVGFINLFKDVGLSIATIQRSKISHSQVSVLFWVNTAVSIVLGLIAAAISPLLAILYSEPRILGITIALAVTFPFEGLAVQHQALLRRQMRFRALAFVEIGAQATSVIFGIVLAFAGIGYWSLVFMQLMGSIARVCLVWSLCPWRPSLPRRVEGIRSMLSFGGYITLSNVLDYVTRNFDRVLMGAVVGAQQVGYYVNAYKLLLFPIQQVNMPIMQVGLPALSRVKADLARFKRYYCRALSLATTIGMPIVAFSFASADMLILLILGEKWISSIVIFRALGPAAFIGTFNMASGWAFVPFGRVREQLYASLFGATVSIVACIVGVHWGAIGVAASFSASVFVKRPIQIMYAYKFAPLKITDFLEAIWRQSTASFFACGVVMLVNLGTAIKPMPLALVVNGALFLFLYLGLFLLLPGGKRFFAELAEIVDLPSCRTYRNRIDKLFGKSFG